MTNHISSLGQVYLICGKTDMLQGIDSLAYLVKTHFELDPFSGQVFLFCGERKADFAKYIKGCKSSMENFLSKVFTLLYNSVFLRKMEMFLVEKEEITYKRKKVKGKRQVLLA